MHAKFANNGAKRMGKQLLGQLWSPYVYLVEVHRMHASDKKRCRDYPNRARCTCQVSRLRARPRWLK